MRLKIAILEDNQERIQAMSAWLSDRLYMYEQCFFNDAEVMNAWLAEHLPQTLLISLDHDLDLIADPDLGWRDPGDGRQVADFLARESPSCPVLIHSTNLPAVQGMLTVLTDAHWTAAAVTPYGDLAWIDEVWWPKLKELLRAAPAATTVPRAVSDEPAPINSVGGGTTT